MGIEQFFSSIEENSITNLLTSFTQKLEKRIHANYLYVDFNSIVYVTSSTVLSELNYLLYHIIIGEITPKFKKLAQQYAIKDIDKLDAETFSSMFTPDKTNKILLDKIAEYIIGMVTNYIEPTMLKLLYIAVDGVPSKSKIIEQKDRRYMGAIINEIKKK